MNEFITLERPSLELNQYLLGEISPSIRAIPVRSMNVNRANEKVTFQLVDVKDIRRPHFLKVLAQVFRFDLLTLTLMPGVLTASLMAGQIQNWNYVAMALLSFFFLHGAIFCRNDYVDHMTGVDRLNEKGGSRVIQNGWLRAITVKRLYHVMLLMTMSLAIPVVLAQPEFLRLKVLPLPIYLMGFYFTWLTLAYVGVRRVISMVVDDEAGIRTLPVRIGFDRAQQLIVGLFILAAITICIYFGISVFRFHNILFALPIVGYIIFLCVRTLSVTSPLSSYLYSLPHKIIQLHFYSGLYMFLMSIL